MEDGRREKGEEGESEVGEGKGGGEGSAGKGKPASGCKEGTLDTGVIKLFPGGYTVNLLHAFYNSPVPSTLLTHIWVQVDPFWHQS